MISKNAVRAFVRHQDEVVLIPNYWDALNDPNEVWECHHVLEIYKGFSRDDLIKKHLYYNVNPEALIFVTRAMHKQIHGSPWKGMHHNEESRRKMSEAAKKRVRRPLSPETRAKISKALMGNTNGAKKL